ncbi:MAG TPA: hypothetical protein VMF11_05450 [Candidatus Baltobacteraceae bacterium]|nr:hypothetical protein [Candidatus Baltobacteraceae bacterium]
MVFGALGNARAATPATVIRLRADHIEFYYDRDLVEADGHVKVTASNGMTITGDAFSMDLKLNRFLIASHVHLRSRGGNLDGAAIADFLDFNRIYFVPVISKPDRWTYENNDFTHPLKGRQMPGDVFYFPDLSTSHVSLSAKSAVIQAKQYVRFADVRAKFFGQDVPLPSYYVYFGSSQDLEENSLSGASFDATWNATGNANSISALHVRYDEFNRDYLGFEQHFAGNQQHEYAVFSVSPFTKDDRYWNLVTGERVGSKFEINTFTQLYTDQHFLAEPNASAQTTFVTMTQAFHRSSLQVFGFQENYNLIGPSEPYSPNHPTEFTATATSYNNKVFKTPLYLQTYEGIGANHDSYGLQDYGGVLYRTIWNQDVGFTLSLPNVEIGDRNKHYDLYYLNAAVNSQRQWYSVPHHVNSQNSTISLSRQFSRFVNSYLSFNEQNTSDLYLQGGYVSSAPLLPDGTPFTPFEAFHGAASLRTTTLGTTYSASPNLVTTIALTHHQDFPPAFPGLYPQPPTNAIGQYISTNYLGQPPWQLFGEVRARIAPHLVVDLQRGYFFHYGAQVWSPSFVVQISE